MIIAHRGLYDNKKIKENTIKAFDKAIQNGCDGFETDLRITKDGKIILMHDPFISRVASSHGLVKKLNYKEIKAKFKDIATLEDITNKYQNQIIFLELKEKIDITKYLDNNNTYYITSFNYNHIKDLPKGNYKRGVLNYVFNTNINYKNLDFIMILSDLITDKIYEFYTNQNIEVVLYGINKRIPTLKKEYLDKIKYIY
ncbi:MAG: glycerophosphodiester phosphodiesterase family protein [bacterium]|nr:glycerophosphodiester phosphodiesterase family protein [bacterium]